MESLLRFVLKQCLDEYVNGMDSKFFFSSSSVTVQDLELRRDKMKELFKDIAEPLEFDSGSIRSLQVRMPAFGELEVEASSVVLNLGFSPTELIRHSLLPTKVESAGVLESEPQQGPVTPLRKDRAASWNSRSREPSTPIRKDSAACLGARPKVQGTSPLPCVQPDGDTHIADIGIPELERLMQAIDDDVVAVARSNSSALDATVACANRVHLITGFLSRDYDISIHDDVPLFDDDCRDGPVCEPLPAPICNDIALSGDEHCDVPIEPESRLQPRTASTPKPHGREINASATSKSSLVHYHDIVASVPGVHTVCM